MTNSREHRRRTSSNRKRSAKGSDTSGFDFARTANVSREVDEDFRGGADDPPDGDLSSGSDFREDSLLH